MNGRKITAIAGALVLCASTLIGIAATATPANWRDDARTIRA